MFGGEGFILQRLQGDGKAFIHADGTIVEKQLRGGRLRLDTGCLVAFTPGIDFGTHRAAAHVRLAYTIEMARLEDGVARLARFL